MPGRILQSLKKAGTSNPVFVLDEIDKLSNSHQGDPSSAMLEVLDPEQNSEFYDNFLEMGFDLSKVMFIATSNNLSTIQPALRDRMEIINVTGYTIEEKVEIGKRHLLPKQLKEHGLNADHLKIAKPQLEKIVEGYTRESGVRGLEKQIAKMVRYAAKNIAMEEQYDITVSNNDIVKAWIAEKKEIKIPLVLRQYGGVFGISAFFPIEDHIYKTVDKFFSWGWTGKRNKIIEPLGNLRWLEKKVSYNPKGLALMVEWTTPRYCYTARAAPLSSQWTLYFDNQMRFISALPTVLKQNFLK